VWTLTSMPSVCIYCVLLMPRHISFTVTVLLHYYIHNRLQTCQIYWIAFSLSRGLTVECLMDLSFYYTAIARLVTCETQVSQTVGRDQTSLGFGRSWCNMHRSDIGQTLMVNHNISWTETKIDSVNLQIRCIPTYCTLCLIYYSHMFQLSCSHLQGVHRKQSKLCMHQLNTVQCLMHMKICCCIQNFSADTKKILGCKKNY
jgi:hypothetical protein